MKYRVTLREYDAYETFVEVEAENDRKAASSARTKLQHLRDKAQPYKRAYVGPGFFEVIETEPVEPTPLEQATARLMAALDFMQEQRDENGDIYRAQTEIDLARTAVERALGAE